MKTREIDVLDILLILVKHKRFIIITTIIVSIAAVIYSFLAPQLWTSSATILPTQEQRSQFSFGSSTLFGLGSSLLGGSFQSQGMDLLTIMNSRTFSEDVVTKFNLIEYFKIKDSDELVLMQTAIENLRKKIINIDLNEDTGLISISVETNNRDLSTNIANYYWQKLEKYNIKSRMNKGKQKREFIESRLLEVKAQLDSLTLAIKRFQSTYNTIDLEKQTRSTITLYTDLVSQKIASEIELEYQQNYFDNNSQVVLSLIRKIEIIKEKIANIEFSETDKKVKFSLNLNEIADISLKYAKLLSQLEIYKKIYEFLFPQLESAKIEEVKDLPTIEIIDKAVPSGKRSKPQRAKICITAFLLGLFFSGLFSVIIENMPKYIEKIHLKKVKNA